MLPSLFSHPQATLPTRTIGAPVPLLVYPPRTSVRLLIVNPSNKILLIRVRSDNYHKLPGGGIEGNESHQEAGIRETREETGCVVEMDAKPFAMTIEWRNEECGKVQCQTSYCYRAILVEETGKRELTVEEEMDGFVCEWVGMQEARARLEGCMPKSGFGKFVREREAWFLDCFEEGLGFEG